MYHSMHIDIHSNHPMYPYFDTVCALSNNLYNAMLFRVRQVMTGIQKEPSERQANEVEVISSIESALPSMKAINDKLQMPTASKWMLSYGFLDAYCKVSKNVDYFSEGLPRHTAQGTIKNVTRDMKAFFEANMAYKKNPSVSLGRPKLPHYKRKGGRCTAVFSNQECVFKDGGLLKFPRTELRLHIGPVSGTLKEVKCKPYYDGYRVFVITDDGIKAPELRDPKRIISIDLGVNNLATITNNIGEPCLLFKGGIIKSQNHWYNKRIAAIASEQTKGTTNKFVPTAQSRAISKNRDNAIRDFMHKTAKSIISWCVEHDIDTIVIGENKSWKQECGIGKVNTQNFVQIPFSMLKAFISYRAGRHGIRVVLIEESYTSKASFIDNDPIPTCGEDGASEASFSGRRAPTSYKGMRRESGFRGLYEAKDGTIINSDLNGSANIGRKAYPEMFTTLGVAPDFSKVTIIVHPDMAKATMLREHQLASRADACISTAKRRRMAKRLRKCNPYGVSAS